VRARERGSRVDARASKASAAASLRCAPVFKHLEGEAVMRMGGRRFAIGAVMAWAVVGCERPTTCDASQVYDPRSGACMPRCMRVAPHLA
jgi:hypothetical protein